MSIVTPPAAARLIDDFLALCVKETTRKAYAQDLNAFARFAKDENAPIAVSRLLSMSSKKAAERVEGFKRSLAAKSVLTFRRRISTLRGLCAFARKHNVITWELAINLRVKRTPKQAEKAVPKDMSGPPPWVVKAIREKLAAAGDVVALRDLAIVNLFHFRGLRVGEVVGMDVEGVSFKNSTVTVLQKGADLPEQLDVNDVVLTSLRRWLDVRPGPKTGPLFIGFYRGGGTMRFNDGGIRNMIANRGRWVGYTEEVLRPHGLRHTSITVALRHAVKNGLEIEDVKEFARHKDINTTIGYLNKKTARVRQVMDSIPA